MSRLLFLVAMVPLAAGPDLAMALSGAAAAARRGDWRSAEFHQRQTLKACHLCTPEDLAVLRAELAGYLTLGGFPEAAIPLWNRSIATLPSESRLRLTSFLGLGVALYAAGRTSEAQKAWFVACHDAAGDRLEIAACRFNIAVARMESASVWSEMEELLPVLLTVDGAISRATVLLQTARAAQLANQANRAVTLLNQADAIIVAELDEKHPFRASVFNAFAQIAAKNGDHKQAKLWKKRERQLPIANGWEKGTVSIEALKKKLY